MLLLIAYDIPSDPKGNRRRARLAKVLQGVGVRVQHSVFELHLPAASLGAMQVSLESVIEAEQDSLRLYPLCATCASRVQKLGKHAPVEWTELLIWLRVVGDRLPRDSHSVLDPTPPLLQWFPEVFFFIFMKLATLTLSTVGLLLASFSHVHAQKFHGIPIVAHRGAGHEFDENTVEACKKSYDQGIRAFEVDLRLTKDGHLILMHDETLKRTAGADLIVEESTLEDIQKHKTVKNQCVVPTAQDLFTYFKDKPDVFIELEMKTSNAKYYEGERLKEYVTKLHRLANEMLPPNTFLFTSFDARALALVKEIDPKAPKLFITGNAPNEAFLKQALDLGCVRVAVVMEHTTRKWVKEAQKAGLTVAGWPNRSVQDAYLAVGLGVDTLTTDVPTQLLEAQR